MNLDQLTDEVARRLERDKPKALLIGQPPPEDGGFSYVREGTYEHVVIGVLGPGALLQMPSDEVCRALLCGLPVWLWPQPYGHGKHGLLLRRELMAAEHRLIRFGAWPVPVGRWREERQHDRRYSNRKSLGNEEV